MDVIHVSAVYDALLLITIKRRESFMEGVLEYLVNLMAGI
jgi:hypothetical protein